MKINSAIVRHVCVALFLSLILSGCASTEFVTSLIKNYSWDSNGSDSYSGSGSKSQGTYKVGNPYKVEGVWYHPRENFDLVETGIASWYGPKFHKGKTANGETFDQHKLTAAHRTLQLPSFARVTNLDNGKSVIVRVNDRGPFKSGRVMDVSMKAAELLGFKDEGTAKVKIQVLERESQILAEAAKRGQDTTNMTYENVLMSMKQEKYSAVNNNGRMMPVTSKPAVNNNPVVASNNVVESDVPESLMTPTITVEELKEERNPVENFKYKPNKAAAIPAYSNTSKSTYAAKTFKSSSEVTQGIPVRTGIFVQAGSFIVYENAQKLAQDLSDIAPAIVEPVSARGQKMYRVKLGPIDTVAEADNILSRVIQSGSSTALIIGKN